MQRYEQAAVSGERLDQVQLGRGVRSQPDHVAGLHVRLAELASKTFLTTDEETGSQCSRELLADAVRDITKLRADVELVVPGTLPNDGKVIEDARSYK